MPTAGGAPAVEFGHIYNTATIDLTVGSTDTWVTVAHASSLTTQAYKCKADNATGLVTVGKGDWKFTVRVHIAGDTVADDLDVRVLVSEPDGTTSSPHGVVPEHTATPTTGVGAHVALFGVAKNVANGTTFAVQVLNATAGNNIDIIGIDFLVEGLRTFPYASQKTSAT